MEIQRRCVYGLVHIGSRDSADQANYYCLISVCGRDGIYICGVWMDHGLGVCCVN